MLKVQAIGHLGNDCNLNTVNGKNVINFSIAHSEKFKDAQGNNREKTIWLNCAYWSDRTAIAPYLKKGTLVFIEGTPEPIIYKDKSGTPQIDFKLRVSQIQLLGASKDNQQNSNAGQQQQQRSYTPANEITEPADDLPF